MGNKVLIDAVEYEIKRTDEPIIVDGQQCWASVDYVKAQIKMRNRNIVGAGREPRLLMHEVVHALLHARGFYDEANNEELVEALAGGVVNLIRDNPKLVEFLEGKEKE